MAHDVVTGSADQSTATQHGVVSGDGSSESPQLDITIPTSIDGVLVQTGVTLVIAIVRGAEVICSDSTWELTATSGASGIFLDTYERAVDNTTGSNPGDIISFLSVTGQELQGGLLLGSSLTAGEAVERVATGAFISDANPAAPIVSSSQAENTIVCIWSATGAITFTPPTGLTSLDTYSSSDFTSRSILIGKLAPGAAGDIDPGAAVASPAATGRAFSVVLHYQQPPPVVVNTTKRGAIRDRIIALIGGL